MGPVTWGILCFAEYSDGFCRPGWRRRWEELGDRRKRKPKFWDVEGRESEIRKEKPKSNPRALRAKVGVGAIFACLAFYHKNLKHIQKEIEPYNELHVLITTHGQLFIPSLSSGYFLCPLFILQQIQRKLGRKETFHGHFYTACHGMFCLWYRLP